MQEKKIGVGVGILILHKGKALLGKRHSDPKKGSHIYNGAGSWCLPGGKLDFGESFEDGIRRETLEETGIVLNKIKLISLNNDALDDSHYVTIGFVCDNSFQGSPKVLEPEKITQWKWFDLDNLPEPLFFPSLRVIDNYKKKKIYISR